MISVKMNGMPVNGHGRYKVQLYAEDRCKMNTAFHN